MKRCQKCNVPLEGAFSVLVKKVLKCRTSDENPSVCNRCSNDAKINTAAYTCQICNRAIDEGSALTHIKAEEYLLHLIKKDHPEWKSTDETCPECVQYYRNLINKAKI